MARKADWQLEASQALRRESWSLRGPGQVVKVVMAGTAASALGGYITQGKFLINKTPAAIETELGLPHGYLGNGARIYRFKRLPHSAEYEYELTAYFPGGLAYTASSDNRYPPGSRKVHQWRIRPGIQIPVDESHFLELKPGEPFPYSWLVLK